MAKTKKKKEALTVSRFISEILVEQLEIPMKNIVNDTTFKEYTGSKRPDLLISDVEYDLDLNNDDEYIQNLVCYAEVKDDCTVGDKDWQDAFEQGVIKSSKLNIPYFVVTNCRVSYFYNSNTKDELKLNGNPIREFQSFDVLRLINKKIQENPTLSDVSTSSDTQSVISEATFNKKLWELANIYRVVNFNNISEKIDFTIGFIALKFFEEKAELDNEKDKTKDYWSDMKSYKRKPDTFVTNLCGYISNLQDKTDFQEFKELMEIVKNKINSDDIAKKDTIEIYEIIDSMGELHESGFDLFGAVYEKFASNKEKSDFGEFFTRRHYTHVFAKLLLKDEKVFDKERKFKVLDVACGTGGFLTEAFKVLRENYKKSGTLSEEAIKFLKSESIFGWDIKEENVSRTKLNMFLVGDGHTHIEKKDTLRDSLDYDSYDYIITNPPYGNGTEKADTSEVSTSRLEISFIAKIIKLLKTGGKACIIIPDGFFENPTFEKFRLEILRKCNVQAIISLPKFAFAPYTKEKTYAIFIEKKSNANTKIQSEDIWTYIIDNDGYANSDKRFPTKQKSDDGSWMHDEIASYIDVQEDEPEQIGYFEQRWMKYDDSLTNGTEWINEKGQKVRFRKAGFIKIKEINKDNFYNLLPEFHLRPYKSNYLTMEELNKELINLKTYLTNLDSNMKINKDELSKEGKKLFSEYVGKVKTNVNFSSIFDYVSRNDSLSEEGIYNNVPDEDDLDLITVLSGSTEDVVYGKIKGNTKGIHVLIDRQALHVVSRGKAGKLTFIPKGTYATNTNAFLFYIKPEAYDLINVRNEKQEEVYLKFMKLYLQPLFFEASSNSDVSVFPLTRIYKSLEIPTFIYTKEMEKVVEKFDLLEKYKNEIQNSVSRIEEIFIRKMVL